jgi:hypothetical protein
MPKYKQSPTIGSPDRLLVQERPAPGRGYRLRVALSSRGKIEMHSLCLRFVFKEMIFLRRQNYN